MKLWKWSFKLGVLALAGGASAVQAQAPATARPIVLQPMTATPAAPGAAAAPLPSGAPMPVPPPAAGAPMPLPPAAGAPMPLPGPAGAPEMGTEAPAANPDAAPAAAPAAAPLGPTPLLDVKIFQKLLTDDDPKPWLHVAGWMDFDYTYRSTGSGENNVAPVMNRFGDEFLTRQLGLYLFKPLDEKTWSWGFNCIFIGGADASFLTPIGGGYANPNPRFGSDFTDLNVTLHMPILTDGGVDVKAGRQTTVLGPMGALPWQRYFDSSDYAWYNEEEGRFTGVSAVWHVNKRLDWYNGFEEGWGSFFDNVTTGIDYITQINYWLDEDAKKTKVWTTVLTGPTSRHSGATPRSWNWASSTTTTKPSTRSWTRKRSGPRVRWRPFPLPATTKPPTTFTPTSAPTSTSAGTSTAGSSGTTTWTAWVTRAVSATESTRITMK